MSTQRHGKAVDSVEICGVLKRHWATPHLRPADGLRGRRRLRRLQLRERAGDRAAAAVDRVWLLGGGLRCRHALALLAGPLNWRLMACRARGGRPRRSRRPSGPSRRGRCGGSPPRSPAPARGGALRIRNHAPGQHSVQGLVMSTRGLHFMERSLAHVEQGVKTGHRLESRRTKECSSRIGFLCGLKRKGCEVAVGGAESAEWCSPWDAPGRPLRSGSGSPAKAMQESGWHRLPRLPPLLMEEAVLPAAMHALQPLFQTLLMFLKL